MLSKATFQKLTAVSGLVGCAIILIGVLLAMSVYEGLDCETYNLGNHFISELGDRRISARSWAFNNGVMLSSICLTFFSFGFASSQKGWLRPFVGLIGLVTGVSFFFVGVYPEDDIHPHLLAAMTFFHSALIMVFFSTGQTLFAKHRIHPRWMVVPGAITAIIFAAFVLWPADIVRSWLKDPVHFVRPSFWWHTTLEWACFFSIILWMICAALLLYKQAASAHKANEI
jgi:hypothetical membrane protein